MTPHDPLPAAAPGRRRAVVVGASLAGLLAARVLSEHFDAVLLLDRDALPAGDEHRKATPHTWHAHGLLARGYQIIEQLFPSLRDEWLSGGGQRADIHDQIAFHADGQRFAPTRSGVLGMALGRAAIEGGIRRRVLALPNVQLSTGWMARELLPGADGRGLRGVGVQSLDGAERAEVPAALVVDASGRGSRLPAWLRSLGYAPPREEVVDIDVRYATAYFERLPGQLPGLEVVLCAATPRRPRPAVIIGQEGRRWVMSIGGYGSDGPPLDHDGFAARAASMGPAFADVVQRSRWLCEPVAYRVARSERRRYEELARLPEGLVAIGDSICAFNPIYGQGMSVAACEALALQQWLARGERQPRAYFRAAAQAVDIPWATSVGGDLALPAVQGERPLPLRLVNAYMARLFAAAPHDAEVARAFIDVAHLLAEPASLLRPAIAWRVWRHVWRGQGQATTATAAPPPRDDPRAAADAAARTR